MIKAFGCELYALVTNSDMLSKLVNSFSVCRNIHELTLRNFKTESEKIQLYGDACHIDVRAYYCMMRVKFAKKIEKIRKNKFKEEAKILKLKYYIIRTNKNCFFSTIRDNFKIDGVSETVKHKIMLL